METLIIKGMDSLANRWQFILAITAIMGVLGVIRGITWPTYEAESLLVLTPLGASGETTKLLGAPYPAKTYQSLLLSPQTIGTTIDRLVAKGKYEADDMPKIDDFTSSLSVYIETIDATTRPVSYSPLVRLSARNSSKDLVAAIVQEWAEVSVEQTNKMLAIPLSAASESLTRQAGELQNQLDVLWQQMAEETGQFDIELMREEAKLRVTQIDKLEADVQLTTRELDGLRKSLESVIETLAKEKPYVELARAPSEAAYWLSEAVGEKPTIEKLGSKVMVSQELNTVYWDLKKSEADLRSHIAAHEATLAALTSQSATSRAELDALEAQIGEHTIKQRNLTSQETIATFVYEDVAKSNALNAATLALVSAKLQSGLWPIGLNSINQNVYVMKSGSFMSGYKVSFVAAVLGFLMSACLVVVLEVVVPWWRATHVAARNQTDS